MFICSRCCRPQDDEPTKAWSSPTKDGKTFNVKFCKICSARIDFDPDCHFTCTDWSEEEVKYKSVKDFMEKHKDNRW